jgi:hypothetical protein
MCMLTSLYTVRTVHSDMLPRVLIAQREPLELGVVQLARARSTRRRAQAVPQHLPASMYTEVATALCFAWSSKRESRYSQYINHTIHASYCMVHESSGLYNINCTSMFTSGSN